MELRLGHGAHRLPMRAGPRQPTSRGSRSEREQLPACAACGKRYRSRPALQRHKLNCVLLEASRTADLTELRPPSREKMYAMLVDLASRHQRLTERFELLRSKQPTKRRRISLCEWLTRTAPAGQNWQDWRDKLQIGRDELELVFQLGHKQGVGQILERALPPGGDDAVPVRSFVQQPSTLFLRCREEGWRPATPEDVIGLVSRVVRHLTRALGQWQRDMVHQRNRGELAEQLTKLVRRTMGTDHASAEVASYVRGSLCRHLRAHACTLVECEVPTDVPGVGDGK